MCSADGAEVLHIDKAGGGAAVKPGRNAVKRFETAGKVVNIAESALFRRLGNGGFRIPQQPPGKAHAQIGQITLRTETEPPPEQRIEVTPAGAGEDSQLSDGDLPGAVRVKIIAGTPQDGMKHLECTFPPLHPFKTQQQGPDQGAGLFRFAGVVQFVQVGKPLTDQGIAAGFNPARTDV